MESIPGFFWQWLMSARRRMEKCCCKCASRRHSLEVQSSHRWGSQRWEGGASSAGILYMGNNRGCDKPTYDYHGKKGYFTKDTHKMGCLGLPGKNGRLIFERWSNLIDGPLWRNFALFPSKNSARSLDWCHSSWPLNYQSIFWRTPNSVKGTGHLVKTSEFTVSKTRQAEKIPNEKSCDSSEIFPYKPCHGTEPIRRIVGCRTDCQQNFRLAVTTTGPPCL